MIVLLDSGPLGLVAHPKGSDEARRAVEWARNLIHAEHRIVIPEIADYEVRRKLLHRDLHKGIERLDALRAPFEYLPLSTQAMQQAARFWAESRRRGLPTCHDEALDGDAILAAQAATHPDGGENVLIATGNVEHLAQFVPAKLWHEIE